MTNDAAVVAGRGGAVSSVAVGDDGILLPLRAVGACTVSFDGQYVLSFRADRDGRRTRGGWFVRWPPVLEPFLDGEALVQVVGHATGATHFEQTVRFGTGARRVQVRDRNGNPLVVNKVGTLSRAFGDTDQAVRREILLGTNRILADLCEHAGVDAFLNYGALLGAIRDGRTIASDCDTDLCYLSRHTRPVDVILESYRVERAMRRLGWQTLRMSGADFKVSLPVGDRRSELVDVFAGFHVDGVYYQLGNRSGRLGREAIVPTSAVTLEEVEFPAPRDPEAMLGFVYGPTWRVPDPAFKFADPPDGVRRLDGWLRGFRTEQPLWNRFYRSPATVRIPRRRSDFARWVRRRIGPGDPVADLGCGTGRDSAFFVSKGHPVISFDGSPEARGRASARLAKRGGTPDVRRLVLNEYRTVVTSGAELALLEHRHHLYARQLVDCVDGEARRNLWRLARMSLHGGGRLFLEFSAVVPGLPDVPADPRGLVHRLEPDAVVAELAAYGGRVVERADGPGTDMFDNPDPWVTRLQVTFAPQGDQHA